MSRKLLSFFIVSVLLFSCSDKELEYEDYLTELYKEDGQAIRHKKIGGYEFTMQYLPSQFLVWQDKVSRPELSQDSLLERYKNSLTFVLTLEVDSSAFGGKYDVMYTNVSNLQEFDQRALLLNFNMSEFISMKVGESEYKPVLATLENTYSLSTSRKVYMVFEELEEWEGASHYDIIFRDALFETSISHFKFNKDELDRLSAIRIKRDEK